MIGTRGVDITAAHQIAISYASTMFMIPLALASATTVQVGHMLGAARNADARIAGFAGISMCAAFMAMSSLVLLVFRDQIIKLYTDDPVVTGIALSLLLVAAIFQIADGVQMVAWSSVLLASTLILMALIDVPFQLWQHKKQLKMTKQEVRDESKETEGNPEIKKRVMKTQFEMAQRRMMEAVPNADVVVTNPTHYAVALRYERAPESGRSASAPTP